MKALSYSLHQVARGIAQVAGGNPPSVGNLSQVERQERGFSIRLADRYLRWAWHEARQKGLAAELVPTLHDLASIVPKGSRGGQKAEDSATVPSAGTG